MRLAKVDDTAMQEVDFRKSLAEERKADRDAARAFVQACERGDVKKLLEAADLLNQTIDGWHHAMKDVAKLP